MMNIIVEIMVEVLNTLALATKEVKRVRLRELMLHKFTIRYSHFYLEKFFRNLAAKTDLEDSLLRLGRLAQAEAQLAAMEQLRLSKNIDDGVRAVQEGVQGTRDGERRGVSGVAGGVQLANYQLSREARALSLTLNVSFHGSNFFSEIRLRDSIRQWLSPPDQSTNHILARKACHQGTAQWFFQGDIFKAWNSPGSFKFLWIHGTRASLLAFTMRQPLIVCHFYNSRFWEKCTLVRPPLALFTS
jgi:hypothetical protein